ncbi:MAG: hypothetical protein R3E36_11890 [Nitrosomonas sp.]|nr:hypothetical protein [Nitrosomonas sp.]
MPNLLVFTTGLDTQMLHPQHWRWTRNLVVASSFDLRLNKELHQKLFPAFRDSQQTEIFYQTLRILESGKELPKNGETNEVILLPEIKKVPPLIFEIGRHGPVRLTLPKEKENSKCPEKNCELKPESEKLDDSSSQTTESLTIHPDDTNIEQSNFRIVLLFGIALAIILIIAGFRPHSGVFVFSLLLSILVILWLALYAANDTTGEPLSFTNGTSLWPTIFMQTTVIFLTIAFIFKGLSNLETNFASLTRQYFKNRDNLKTLWPEREPRSFRSFFTVNQSCKSKLLKDNQSNKPDKGPKALPFYRLAVLLILTSGAIYAVNDAYPENFPFILCVFLLSVLVALYFWIEHTRPFAIKAIIFWEEIDSQNKQSELNYLNILIYGCLFLFVLICIILFIPPNHSLFEQIVSEITPDDNWITAVIIISIFIVIITICFLIADCLEATDHTINTSKFIILEESESSGLWREYYQHGRFEQILFRVAVMWLFFAIIETILFYLLPPWPSPCRGAACDWNQWIGTFGFIFTMLLTFFVLDAVRLNYYFIRKLRTKHPLLLDDSVVLNTELPSNDIKKFYRERKDNPLETLEKIVTLVAERTLVADKLIYYPLLCIMLMLFARIAYFDNQDFPLSKGITFGAGISLLIFSGFMIRYEAQKLKQAAVTSAENLVGNTDPDGHHCVRKLKEIKDGIFQPMLEQPVMRALLLILASVGLFAGEYLMLAGF